ncbi:MAG: winged helix-turn-helix transcriptional regulator [Candidatus Pacebacteria bacterium]|nr:winged helix-turn-helix transcriptional regulator [Candidatus Paceibacterota bacterium]
MKFTGKQVKLLELFSKAVANRNRIKILVLINKKPKLNVAEISDILKMNYQSGAVHIQRLEKVGFVYKRYKGLSVEHVITERGKLFLIFFEKILNLKS